MRHPLETKHRNRQMLLLSVGTFCVFLAMLSLIPLLPIVSEELNISKSSLGWVAGVFMICMAFLQIPFGLLSDKFGRKKIIIVGILVFGVGVAMLSISHSFAALLVARAISGSGAAMFFQASFTMVGDMYDFHERGKGMGILAAATGLGTVSGYSVGGVLGELYGWRIVFIWLAAFALIVSMLSLMLHETRPQSQEEHRLGKLLYLSLDLFRTRTIMFATFVGMLCMMAVVGASYVLPFFALDSGISTASTGLLFIPYAITSSFGASSCGWLSDIVGRKKPLVAVTLLGGIALLLFSHVPISPWLIAINFAFVGLCFGPVVTLSTTILVDEVVKTDTRILATTMGTFNMVRWLGGALGPVLGGVFLDTYGARTAFTVLAGMIFVAAVFSVGLRETKY
ncbi:MAG: MFS transporter [Methanosarcinaceae archaeon]|nr:MFS transporter [Methanosarcinaceae archaeon]MDF1533488.1 MFS transporter [Methanosarcinaceae archaeon]